jgi:two-component system nitrate/nitrite response regulator NarL
MNGRRVLLADDDAATRAALRRVLEAHDFSVCGEAGDAAEAIAVARTERPDLALIEIRIPGNGLHATAEIVTELPDITVVIVTVSSENADLLAALRLGASGYLLKDIGLERIPNALRAVLDGETALPRSLVGRVVDELRRRGDSGRLRLTDDRAVRLTDREWEVLDLVRNGLTTQAIADQLFISPVTVRTHISVVLKKLGVPDRAAAIRVLEDVEARDQPEL